MAKNILADLVLRLSADSADLKKGLAEAKGSLDSINKNSQNVGKQVLGAFTKLAAGVAAAAGAFKFIKGSMEAVEGPGDKLAETIAGAKGALFELQKAVATLDFRNLINNMIDGWKAGKAFEAAMDELAIKSAYATYKIAGLERQSADLANQIAQTTDITKKSLLADERLKIELQIAEETTKIGEEEFQILKDNWKAKNKLTAEQALKAYETVQGFGEKETAALKQAFDANKKLFGSRGLEKLSTTPGANTQAGTLRAGGVTEEQLKTYKELMSLEGGEADNLKKLFDILGKIESTRAKAEEGKKKAYTQDTAFRAKDEKDTEKEIVNIEKKAEAEIKALEEAAKTEIELQKQIIQSYKERDKAYASMKGAGKIAVKGITPTQTYNDLKVAPEQRTGLTQLEGEYTQGLLSEKDYIDQKYKLEIEGARKAGEDTFMITSMYIAKTKELEKQAQDEKILKWEEATANIRTLLSSITNFQEAAMNKELENTSLSEDQKDAIRRKYARKRKIVAIAETLINGAVAISKAFRELGPIAGIPAAIAMGIMTASQVALISSQPLAKGGIAYGPTLATVGEYPGARTNPEIITPLSKLKDLLKDTKAMQGEVRFVIEQEQLVGILKAYDKKQIYF